MTRNRSSLFAYSLLQRPLPSVQLSPIPTISVGFSHKSIVHFEFTDQGQTMNQHCYLDALLFVKTASNFSQTTTSPWQGSSTWWTKHSPFSGKKTIYKVAPSTSFARFGILWLLKRMLIIGCVRYSKAYGQNTEEHTGS